VKFHNECAASWFEDALYFTHRIHLADVYSFFNLFMVDEQGGCEAEMMTSDELLFHVGYRQFKEAYEF
jgi:hypothetical protein